MVFHGSRLFFMVPGRFSWFFMVLVWFFMVPGWFFIGVLQNVPAELYPRLVYLVYVRRPEGAIGPTVV